MLTDGVFYAANQLYGLTFKERHDIPTWNPDMRVFEVYRPGRQAARPDFISTLEARQQVGRRVDEQPRQPVVPARHASRSIYNVENFTKPAPGQPALISFDDVTTMFHEFGHALHGMFAAQTYPTLSGTNVARDFVEFPSQFNENWALDPKVLAALRGELQDRAADPAGAGRQDQALAHLQPGL